METIRIRGVYFDRFLLTWWTQPRFGVPIKMIHFGKTFKKRSYMSYILLVFKFINLKIQTFCGWVNMHLSKRDMRVNDLEKDFCDGVKLIALLEILNDKKIEGRYYKNPKSKPYMIDNVHFALNIITDVFGVKLIQCSPEGMV